MSTPENIQPPAGGEPYLLTPGPLTTAASVKQAMQVDWGSWDEDFRALTRDIRSGLLAMLADHNNDYECVPMQGSGSFVVESMLGTLLPRDSKSLVLINGAYGKRIAQTLARIGRDYIEIDKGDYLPPRAEEVRQALESDPAISHVIVVHCETSSGILNPIEEISDAVYASGKKLLIDSMSGFGALPLQAGAPRFDAFVSSANKCIEGVPGFGFLLVRRDTLEHCEGNCHSLALDAFDQWVNMEKTGQWRYTPPTHALAAFSQALRLHRDAGGTKARLARYTANRDLLVDGMRKLGFNTLLDGRWLSPIIITFFNPLDPAFNFARFYDLLKIRGYIIYPGKLTQADSFRIGCIGQLDTTIIQGVIDAVGAALLEMGVTDASGPQIDNPLQ